MTVVSIAGMHRSGTSMITRMLQLCGFYLGGEEDIIPAAFDNPEGFWENRQFQLINEEILKKLSGDWDFPPNVNIGWETQPDMMSIRVKAARLIDQFSQHENWAWKDPRNSLTIPFWRQLLPNMKVLICLRNPLEVAYSLTSRNYFSRAASYNLWLTYNQRVLSFVEPQNRIVTHYDAYFTNPKAELTRIFSLLGVPVSERTIEKAVQAISLPLRHNRAAFTDLFEDGASPDVIKLYDDMCAQAGTVFQSIPQPVADVPSGYTENYKEYILNKEKAQLQAELFEKEKEIHLLVNQASRKDQTIQSLLLQVFEGEHTTLDLSSQILDRQKELLDKDQKIQVLLSQMKEISSHEQEKEVLWSQIHSLNLQLAEITGSMAWSLITRMRRMRLWFFPQGSSREKILRMFFQGLRIWKQEGLRSLFQRSRQKMMRLLSARKRNAKLEDAPHVVGEDLLEDFPLDIQIASTYPSVATSYDVIILPIIDWHFRFQRPQQIARRFSQDGHRVFYMATTFKSGVKTQVTSIENGVFEVQLPGSESTNIYSDSINDQMVETLHGAFASLQYEFNIENAVCIVDLPFWRPIAFNLRDSFGWKVIYDCMDHHRGFNNTSEKMLQEEDNLIENSDLVIASSHLLFDEIKDRNLNCRLVPNATDVDHFRHRPSSLPKEMQKLDGPVIGYYGAISDWFNSELIAVLALARPHWNFVLIGHTFGSDLKPIDGLPNVHLVNETPYDLLPAYLHVFDVCIIPFKKTPLTDATNPVKLFEFLSAGKAVVATDLDELRHYADFVRLATSTEEWLDNIEAALKDNSPEQVARRVDFAAQNTWDDRYTDFKQQIPSVFPKASIIVVTYNNIEYTRLCLTSIYEKTIYPNFEVIVVDNASSDGTQDFLRAFASTHENVQIVYNERNEGFARANNIGIANAKGKYIILLNNDTVVTKIWLSRLIRHLSDLQLGMVGSVTNGVSNEARVEMQYVNPAALDEFAAKRARERANMLTPIKMLAMYCVAGRREVFQQIGSLDEQFGIGMFEDDDYSLRVRRAGYKISVAEDVFIHHFGQSGFKVLGDDRYFSLFEENRRKFETKWNLNWEQHITGTLAESRQFTADLKSILIENSGTNGVIIFPPTIGWNIPLFQRPHQLARAFAEIGFLVFFCTIDNIDDVSGFKQVSPGLYLANVPWAVFDLIERPVIFTLPYNREYLFRLRNPLVVYEIIDDLDVFPGDKKQLQSTHEILLKEAGVIVVTADRLMDSVRQIRPDAILCPNAVELEHFSKFRGLDRQIIPDDLASIIKTGRPILGYYGALARWFDYDLVHLAAKKHPEWDFVLIGPDHDNSLKFSNILSVSNIHWLGVRDYSELPDYLFHFNVAMIPFLVNNITIATSPIKLFEYMAGGKPIVTTDMPECRKYPGVLVARDAEEFLNLLEHALTLGADSAYIESLYQTASKNTWRVRAEQIVSAFEKKDGMYGFTP